MSDFPKLPKFKINDVLMTEATCVIVITDITENKSHGLYDYTYKFLKHPEKDKIGAYGHSPVELVDMIVDHPLLFPKKIWYSINGL